MSRCSARQKAEQYLSYINDIGSQESRHDERQSYFEKADTEGLSKSSSEVAQNTGIHSMSTYDNYKSKITDMVRFFRANTEDKITGEKFIESKDQLASITPAGFNAYFDYLVNDKLTPQGEHLSDTTLNSYATAINKLQCAINTHYQEIGKEQKCVEWRPIIQEFRDNLDVIREGHSVHFDNPQSVVDAFDKINHNLGLACKISYTQGFRIENACHFRVENGMIQLDKTKSQMPMHDIEIRNDEVRKEIAGILGTNPDGSIKDGKIDLCNASQIQNRMSDVLKSIGEKTGNEASKFKSFHSFRHNYAIERREYLESKEGGGYNKKESALIVSRELGHNRVDVVEKYYMK